VLGMVGPAVREVFLLVWTHPHHMLVHLHLLSLSHSMKVRMVVLRCSQCMA
jgi:hypothetical protein